jgi:hypothetical protein
VPCHLLRRQLQRHHRNCEEHRRKRARANRSGHTIRATAGILLAFALVAAGCGGARENAKRSSNGGARAAARTIPQPPSNLNFAYGFAGSTCGSQGLNYSQYGVSREVYVCIGAQVQELQGKAQCFLGQPSPDTTGTNMLGQYDVKARTVVPGGSSLWPKECATTFTSMLEWYYHKTHGTLKSAPAGPSTNAAPATAAPGAAGILRVKQQGDLTCYSTSQKYTFPDGEASLIGICETRAGSRTCAAYQQSSGQVVTIGFPNSSWAPECVAALRLVKKYQAGGGPNSTPASNQSPQGPTSPLPPRKLARLLMRQLRKASLAGARPSTVSQAGPGVGEAGAVVVVEAPELSGGGFVALTVFRDLPAAVVTFEKLRSASSTPAAGIASGFCTTIDDSAANYHSADCYGQYGQVLIQAQTSSNGLASGSLPHSQELLNDSVALVKSALR